MSPPPLPHRFHRRQPRGADGAFNARACRGCAGQRCLASSVAITDGEAGREFSESIANAAKSRQVGYGFDKGVQMGPVINAESKSRVEGLIEKGVRDLAGKLN